MSQQRFIINNGMATDTTTGLMWQQETAGKMTWKEVIKYCRNLRLGGHDDWRLPTIEELFCLADRNRCNPAIDIIAFPGTVSSFYWSSTTLAFYTYLAWGVDFGNGDDSSSHKSDAYYVRAVRGGQCGSFGDLAIMAELDEIAKAITELSAKLRGGKP